jgi:hypothetical protein
VTSEGVNGVGRAFAKPAGLDQVADRAFRALRLQAPGKAEWEPQYCTTNSVVATGTFVFKRYRHRNAFLVERKILALRDLFTFQVPDIVFSLDDPEAGCWNVFGRLPGLTLAEAVPGATLRHVVVDKMIDALVEFERVASTLVEIKWVPWSWASAIEPLAKFCSDHGAQRAAETLGRETQHWDSQWEREPRVPCFDLYSRNVIWSAVHGGASVGFVDFDKADRLVPRGEQLSHLAMMPRMKGALRRGLDRYRTLTGVDHDLLEAVAAVSSLCRALAGVRDSLPWTLLAKPSPDPHAALRRSALAYSLRQAAKRLSPVLRDAPDQARRLSALRRALADITELVRVAP